MDTLPEIPPEQPPFRRPADYYESPVEGVRPIFPRWVPFGCGTASLLLLFVLGGVAVGISRGTFSGLFEMMFSSMQTEIDKMMGPDVKPQQKAAFDAEMKTLRERVRTHSVKMDRLQPLMRVMRDAVTDERVTPAEADQLTREIHKVNTAPAK